AAHTYLTGGFGSSAYNLTETVTTVLGDNSGNINASGSLTYTESMPEGWKGCVEERDASGRGVTDDPPSVERFIPYYYPDSSDNDWVRPLNTAASNPSRQAQGVTLTVDQRNIGQDAGYGPNLGCGGEVTPMTPNKSTIVAGINHMLPWHRGGTSGDL